MDMTHHPPTTAETNVSGLPGVTLLVTTGCQYCEDARSELSARSSRAELNLDIVSVGSAYGKALQAAHRPAMFPLVLIDGKRFSVGRLPRRKLDRALSKRAVR
jgi:glutaredoxin